MSFPLASRPVTFSVVKPSLTFSQTGDNAAHGCGAVNVCSWPSRAVTVKR